MRVGQEANPRSLRNFPCQANGAEMLRWACSLATERGLEVVAPVHDALLVEGPARETVSVVAEAQRAMEEASEAVLDGFRLRSDARIVRWPDRYMDDRGRAFWDRVMGLLPVTGGEEREAPPPPPTIVRMPHSPLAVGSAPGSSPPNSAGDPPASGARIRAAF